MRRYRVVCDDCGRRWPIADSPDEARVLARVDGRHRCGSTRRQAAAGDDLAAHAYRLARTRVRLLGQRYRVPPAGYDDVLSDAMLGAAQALDRYDPTAGVKPSTFLVRRIDGAIIDGLRDRSVISRADYQKGVRHADLAPWQREAVSYDMPLGEADDDGMTLAGTIADSVDEVARAEARADVAAALEALERAGHTKQAMLVRWHHLEGVTLAECAARFGVTESRACQMNAEAMRRLAQWATTGTVRQSQRAARRAPVARRLAVVPAA